ncbi:MAG: hypothetical protein ACTH31_02840 [Pseudoclavibacter sp.]
MTTVQPRPVGAPAGGPYADQHLKLREDVETCIARLTALRQPLEFDGPAAMSAATAMNWLGPARWYVDHAAQISELTRSGLVSATDAALGHYGRALAQIEATI